MCASAYKLSCKDAVQCMHVNMSVDACAYVLIHVRCKDGGMCISTFA